MKYAILGIVSIAFISCAQIKELEATVDTLKGDLAKVQVDNDGDGVSDAFDMESKTPYGSLVDGSGRALDLDGDGVRHELDTDPFTQRGARVDASGRELDSDGDGVLDSKDQEQNTPAGALVNFLGKKIEGTLSNKVAAAFIPEMYFSTNSATLSPEDEAKLTVVAKMMKANPSLRLCVVGHTDKTGSERVNLKVGERRAKSVVRSLTTTFQLSEARFEIKTKGESELLSTKNLHNRRVEFQFIK